MKSFFLLFIFLFSTLAYSQEYEIIEEIVEDNNGNIISVTESKVYKYSEPEELLDLFYTNQNDVETLTSLISYRMFEVTPVEKFKDMFNAKNIVVGEYVDKEIISSEYTENDSLLTYVIKVKYTKANTLETLYLIRESFTEKFRLAKYTIEEDR